MKEGSSLVSKYAVLWFSILLVLGVSYLLLHELPFATNGLLQEHYDQYRVAIHSSYAELFRSLFSFKTQMMHDVLNTKFEEHRLFQISWRPVFFLYYKVMYDCFGLNTFIPFLIRYLHFVAIVSILYLLLYDITQRVGLAFFCAMLYFFSPGHWVEDYWLVTVRTTMALSIMLVGIFWSKVMVDIDHKIISKKKFIFYYFILFFVFYFLGRLRDLIITAPLAIGIYALYQCIKKKWPWRNKKIQFNVLLTVPVGVLQCIHTYFHDFPAAPSTIPRYKTFWRLFYLGSGYSFDELPAGGFLFSLKNYFPASLLGNLGPYVVWVLVVALVGGGILYIFKKPSFNFQAKIKPFSSYLISFFICWFLAELVMLSLGDQLRHASTAVVPLVFLVGVVFYYVIDYFKRYAGSVSVVFSCLLGLTLFMNIEHIKFFHRLYLGRTMLTSRINEFIYHEAVPILEQTQIDFYENLFYKVGKTNQLVPNIMIIYNKRDYAYFSDFGDAFASFYTKEELSQFIQKVRGKGFPKIFVVTPDASVLSWVSSIEGARLIKDTEITSATHDFLGRHYEKKRKNGKVWIGVVELDKKT